MFNLTFVLKVLICFLIMAIIGALLGTIAALLIDIALRNSNKGDDHNDSDKR